MLYLIRRYPDSRQSCGDHTRIPNTFGEGVIGRPGDAVLVVWIEDRNLMACGAENESCAAGGRAASEDDAKVSYRNQRRIRTGSAGGADANLKKLKIYDGPQVPSGALPAAEPTPIATGCDTMPL